MRGDINLVLMVLVNLLCDMCVVCMRRLGSVLNLVLRDVWAQVVEDDWKQQCCSSRSRLKLVRGLFILHSHLLCIKMHSGTKSCLCHGSTDRFNKCNNLDARSPIKV